MSETTASSGELKRGLKNRHIQLIALGGAIGTGLFLGSAGVLKSAGPSMILGYAICGFIAFMIMRQLGEMIVEEPVAGSFSHFAHNYWGGFAGFLSGWNCWLLYILVGMSELTAVGKYIHYWLPDIPSWVSAAAFFILINAINLTNVKVFGETEFWFAIIKVVAIIGMIALGSYMLVSGSCGPQASVSNLWEHGGFFPNGVGGLVMALAIIMFSFGGLEMLGFTAAEAEQPKTVIPKAINQVIYRILIFYIGALVVLLSLTPWDSLLASLNASGDSYSGSPFVQVFSMLGSDAAAHILNFVVLTAALSVYNSGTYCNSRMLVGMAEQGAGAGRQARGAGQGYLCVCRGDRGGGSAQLLRAAAGAGAVDVAGSGHPGHQLGDDQLFASEIPPAHEPYRPSAAVQGAVVSLR
ncbi:Aromatic amino acid transport protein aroP [Pseudomonas savastanoi pv. retacarpa]|nr:Aromatic amino acid transport protein aroP [Pseudomonas savastanoi pv. retacarpa]RMP51265.1 Aromatic amino acid permease [Pseudomonas savastanoi pv. retacarpa]